jgi:glycosyltransferase involved in cell wall biosynthesis
MRIVQITPGTGNFYCGNCMRDNAMVTAMRRRGHDVLMIPLYLPHVVDEPSASEGVPMFFGGINVYLQQKIPLFRRTPRWLDRLFDAAGLLRWAADRSAMTTARDLGEITVSMLAGEEGQQSKELTKLIEFLRSGVKPDVVLLSNVILLGLARRIRREMSAAVICTMAGEDAFIDSLTDPYRTQAWELLQSRAVDVDAFVPVSRYYDRIMRRRMNLPEHQVQVIYNGIEVAGYGPAPRPTRPTIGYLARMCPGKGLATLVDAFILLKKSPGAPDARLIVAGSANVADGPFVHAQQAKLRAAGLEAHAEWRPNVSHQAKQDFLRELTLLSVPATYGESFGLYLLEAWASGVPVVQPDHAAFPELIELTGGGMLCKPDDPVSLAQALRRMLDQPEEARRMGQAARRAVLDQFTVDHMADAVLEMCERCAGRSPTPTRRP